MFVAGRDRDHLHGHLHAGVRDEDIGLRLHDAPRGVPEIGLELHRFLHRAHRVNFKLVLFY